MLDFDGEAAERGCMCVCGGGGNIGFSSNDFTTISSQCKLGISNIVPCIDTRNISHAHEQPRFWLNIYDYRLTAWFIDLRKQLYIN